MESIDLVEKNAEFYKLGALLSSQFFFFEIKIYAGFL